MSEIKLCIICGTTKRHRIIIGKSWYCQECAEKENTRLKNEAADLGIMYEHEKEDRLKLAGENDRLKADLKSMCEAVNKQHEQCDENLNWCMHCGASQDIYSTKNLIHRDNCKVIKAREILKRLEED